MDRYDFTRLDKFLSEVDQKSVAPPASKPLTLRFLLSIYRKGGTFPSNQEKLYYEGLLRLCEEQNPFRHSARFRGNLSGEQRLIVASRIAALTVFTNHAVVRTGTELNADASESDIMLRGLGSGLEHINEYEVIIDEKALEETLNTGLFIARGLERFGWAHRTYAEFLAAWYLVQHKVTLLQIMSLLLHSDETQKRLIPQLHETAAWIATMRPDVFDQIMHIEPEVLLRSDVATAGENARAALVEALLLLQDVARQARLYHKLRSFYWKLNNPGLYSQLSPFIRDSAANEAVRMLAIDIAVACRLQALQSILVDIALNPSEPLLVRTQAAHAIIHISDEETKAKLKPLVLGSIEGDPEDELKGCAFQAVWPRYITAKELFAALTPPKRQNYYGAYQRFLESHFITYLQPADLLIALQWVEERVSCSDGRYQYSVFFPITHEILLLTWKHLDMSGVLEAFARVIVASVEHYAVVEDQERPELIQLFADESKRRQVLAATLRECVQRESDPIRLFDYRPRLMLQRDIFWLIEYFSQTEIEALQRAIACLIGRLINVNTMHDDELMNAVYNASLHNPYLASELSLGWQTWSENGRMEERTEPKRRRRSV
jgi:predicted NACHT family NTPase